MGEHEIAYRDHPKDQKLPWATHCGTRAAAIESGKALLREMKESGLKHAAVWVDGRRVRE